MQFIKKSVEDVLKLHSVLTQQGIFSMLQLFSPMLYFNVHYQTRKERKREKKSRIRSKHRHYRHCHHLLFSLSPTSFSHPPIITACPAIRSSNWRFSNLSLFTIFFFFFSLPTPNMLALPCFIYTHWQIYRYMSIRASRLTSLRLSLSLSAIKFISGVRTLLHSYS